MTLWTSQDLSFALKSPTSVSGSGISIDSRTLQKGDLFIAIKGPKFDGHQFIQKALTKGAAGVICSNPISSPHILVKDTHQALKDLATYRRSQIQGKIIGLTGSFGKTITKEFLRLALRNHPHIFISPHSYNNHYGVPLSLALMPKETSVGVFEIGMNHPGEILELSSLVRPHIAAITNIGCAHLENFPSLEGIRQAKFEIFQPLESYGIGIVPDDLNPPSPSFMTFGSQESSTIHLLSTQSTDQGNQITTSSKGESFSYHLPSHSSSDIMNSLCALTIMEALSLDHIEGAQAFTDYHPLEGRGNIKTLSMKEGQFTLIDESYSAAPLSMEESLKTLGAYPGRKIAVLGDMLELGPDSVLFHKELLTPIMQNAIDLVFTCGPKMHDLYTILPKNIRGGHSDDVTGIAKLVAEEVQPQDVIMVKGSKAVRMSHGRMYHVIQTLQKKGS